MTPDHLLATLQRHIGAALGITAEQLATAHGCEKRHIRSLISELRMDGHAVCGHPRTGYYMAETGAEIEDTCNFLRSRAMHSLTLESRLRKTTLPELLGQLKLKT